MRGEHAGLIREIAARGTVLLKNENKALPLRKPRNIAVFGPGRRAQPGRAQRLPRPRLRQRHAGSGLGLRARANYPYLVTPDMALQAQARDDGSIYQAVLDNYASTAIAATAAQADVALVFVSADAGEGYIAVDGNIGGMTLTCRTFPPR